MLGRSAVSDSFVITGTVTCQGCLSMGFSRQEYWSRLQFLSPGDLPNPRIKPMSLALAGRFFIYRACREEGKGKGLGDYNTFT